VRITARLAVLSAGAHKAQRSSSVVVRRHLSPGGEATKWLNIFAEENFVSKILCRQGEGLEQGKNTKRQYYENL
jgi:hypothetical protein